MEEVSIKEGVNYIEVVVVNALHHNDGLNEETDSFVADNVNDVSERKHGEERLIFVNLYASGRESTLRTFQL